MLISSLSAGIAGRLVERRKAWSARHRLQGTLCEHLTRRAVVARTRPTTLSSSTARPIDRCDVPTRRRLSSSRFGHPPILQLAWKLRVRLRDLVHALATHSQQFRDLLGSDEYVAQCGRHRTCCRSSIATKIDSARLIVSVGSALIGSGRFGLFRFMSCCGAAARRLSLAHAPRRRSLAFVAKRPVRARASGPPTGTRRPCQPRQ